MKDLKEYKHTDWYVFKHYLTKDDVFSLVEKKAIPHYIVKHPISKEETIMFNIDELKEWFYKFNSQYVDANDLPECEINVLLTIDQDTALESIDKIPKELSLTPNLQEFKTASIVAVPCVYFLCRDKKIVYIGQTINIQNRINQHLCDNEKQFDSVFFIHVHQNQLLKVEASLIRYLRPPLNKQKIGKAKKQDEETSIRLLSYLSNKLGSYCATVIDPLYD